MSHMFLLSSIVYSIDTFDVVVMVSLMTLPLIACETYKALHEACTYLTSGQYDIYDIIQIHYLLPQAVLLTMYYIDYRIDLTDALTGYQPYNHTTSSMSSSESTSMELSMSSEDQERRGPKSFKSVQLDHL